MGKDDLKEDVWHTTTITTAITEENNDAKTLEILSHEFRDAKAVFKIESGDFDTGHTRLSFSKVAHMGDSVQMPGNSFSFSRCVIPGSFANADAKSIVDSVIELKGNQDFVSAKSFLDSEAHEAIKRISNDETERVLNNADKQKDMWHHNNVNGCDILGHAFKDGTAYIKIEKGDFGGGNVALFERDKVGLSFFPDRNSVILAENKIFSFPHHVLPGPGDEAAKNFVTHFLKYYGKHDFANARGWLDHEANDVKTEHLLDSTKKTEVKNKYGPEKREFSDSEIETYEKDVRKAIQKEYALTAQKKAEITDNAKAQLKDLTWPDMERAYKNAKNATEVYPEKVEEFLSDYFGAVKEGKQTRWGNILDDNFDRAIEDTRIHPFVVNIEKNKVVLPLIKDAMKKYQEKFGVHLDFDFGTDAEQNGKWLLNEADGSEVLCHKFKDTTAYFKLENDDFGGGYTGLSFFPDKNSMETAEKAKIPFPHHVLPGFHAEEAAKKIVASAIEHYGNQDFSNAKGFIDYKANEAKISHSLVEQAHKYQNSPIADAKKAGYVQGVCECAAVVSSDKNLCKKLLSEMKVTKDMARKYSDPETYKTLEQTAFAPKISQKLELEQKQGRKR